MRMRKLGYGQSVMIIAPEDIDRAIKKAADLNENGVVDVCHVLQWSMLETCADISQHIPHWAEQGVDYERRRQGLTSYDESLDVDVLRESWLRPEARTLEQVSSRTIALITSKSSQSSHTDVWHHDFFPRDPRALATRTRA